MSCRHARILQTKILDDRVIEVPRRCSRSRVLVPRPKLDRWVDLFHRDRTVGRRLTAPRARIRILCRLR